jgi:hypothetical protein
MAEAWRRSAVYSYGRKVWLQRPDDFLLHRVQRDGKRRSAMTILTVPEARGDSWLQLDDEEFRFASVIPHGSAETRFLVQTFRRNEGPLVGMEVELDRGCKDQLGEAARLWSEYRRGSIQRAGARSILLRNDTWSGDAGALAAVIVETVALLASNAKPLAEQGWLDSFSVGDDLAADVAVLRFEYRLRSGDKLDEAEVQMLIDGLESGIPRIGPLASLLASRADLISGVLARARLGSEIRPHFIRWIGEWKPYLAGVGLFTTFAGTAKVVRPSLLAGLRNSIDERSI